jgi:hypothetical protein
MGGGRSAGAKPWQSRLCGKNIFRIPKSEILDQPATHYQPLATNPPATRNNLYFLTVTS